MSNQYTANQTAADNINMLHQELSRLQTEFAQAKDALNDRNILCGELADEKIELERENENLKLLAENHSAKLADTKSFVDRFLCWNLPKSVNSDLCVTIHNYPHQRSGTSLLTADEAREMIDYLLAEARQALADKERE